VSIESIQLQRDFHGLLPRTRRLWGKELKEEEEEEGEEGEGEGDERKSA
jgi:hypothetical protein